MTIFQFNDRVKASQIDYNGHFHDSSYHEVFSESLDAFFSAFGLSKAERTEWAFTVFTLEAHITYLKEITVDTPYTISIYIHDYDVKRAHLFLIMTNDSGDDVATYEVMMMGISQETRRSAAFPQHLLSRIETYVEKQSDIPQQHRIGHVMHIPHKKG